MRLVFLAAAAASFLGFSGAASAATVNFTQQGTFSTPQFDFAGGSVTGSSDVYLLNANGLGITNSVVGNGEFVTFSFDAPVTDVSLLIVVASAAGNNAAGLRTVDLFGVGGAALGSFSQSGAGQFDLSSLVAGALITSFTLTAAADTNFRIGSLSFEVVSSEVPLPAALPLFLAGLAGLGVARRRKKEQAVS